MLKKYLILFLVSVPIGALAMDIEQLLKSKYPHLSFQPLSKGKSDDGYTDVNGVFRDKKDLAREFFYHATLTPTNFEESLLYEAKADTVTTYGNPVYSWEDIHGKQCFYNTTTKTFLDIEHPDHRWSRAFFDEYGGLLFAEATNQSWTEYWVQRQGVWEMLARAQYNQQQMVMGYSTDAGKDFHYLCTYQEGGLATFELLKEGRTHPTNFRDLPLTIFMCPDFIVDAQNPQTIIGVLQNRGGYRHMEFLVNQEANQERLAFMISRAKEKKLLPDFPLSFGLDNFKVDDSQFLTRISFTLGGGEALRGSLEHAQGESGERDVAVAFEETESSGFPHPLLQMRTIYYGDRETFYLYTQSPTPSGTTIVMVDGGPHTFYQESYQLMAHLWCTQQGHTLIFPQETLRTGFGYNHYKAGLGQMGSGNLHQIVDMIQDGIQQKIIPHAHAIHLWGHSYGGFVAASMALRVNEFLKPPGTFRGFKSIIAECPAMLSNGDKIFARLVQSETDMMEPLGAWSKKISPLSYLGNTPSQPLLIITGDEDVRCEVHATDQYAKALQRHPHVAYIKHAGGHKPLVMEPADLKVRFALLDGFITGAPVSVSPEQLAEHGIDIVFGERLLLVQS